MMEPSVVWVSAAAAAGRNRPTSFLDRLVARLLLPGTGGTRRLGR